MPAKSIFSTGLCILAFAVILSGCGKGGGNPAASGGGGVEPDIPIEGTIFEDDFEDGLDNWGLDPYWDIWGLDSNSGTYCLHAYDNASTAGQANLLTSFNFSACDTAALVFWQRMNYGNMSASGSEAFVLIEVDDSEIFSVSLGNFQYASPWTQYLVSLTPFCGYSQVEIAFYYEKYALGTIRWWIDDVVVAVQ
jgi:hypothetical protein